jgi:Domain of unknown function (DUF4253)
MIDSLAKALLSNGLEPDSFKPCAPDERIFRGELPAGKSVETWVKLAKAAVETKYWPIIRGGVGDDHEPVDCDAEAVLAAAPSGGIREILEQRTQERREGLASFMPEFAQTADMDALAWLADDRDIHSFGGATAEPWPTKAPDSFSFHTVKSLGRKPASVQLIRVAHSYEVPAYLGFGGWNDCPCPELQVAVLREWQKEYNSVPACITNDVLECVVVKPPQTEKEALKLAAEQWIFCDDIVGQGTQTIRKLGMEIWRSPTWFFWWD